MYPVISLSRALSLLKGFSPLLPEVGSFFYRILLMLFIPKAMIVAIRLFYFYILYKIQFNICF